MLYDGFSSSLSHWLPNPLMCEDMDHAKKQHLLLFHKVAMKAVGFYLFFFFFSPLHFVEMMIGRCQTFLNTWEELFSGSSA